MRIIIIGAVAAGTSAAAKARRNTEEAEIVIYEKDSYISYSGCGMPYFIGGSIDDGDKLTPRDPAFFKSKYNVDILTGHEVMTVEPNEKTVTVKRLDSGEIFKDRYDRLVLATGAKAVLPPIDGVDGGSVFTLRNINDMYRIKRFIDVNSPESAVIVGTGFIGLEMCENLCKLGIKVTLLEKLDQVTPGLDSDMALYVREHLETKGVRVHTGVSVEKITPTGVELADGATITAQLVIVSTGVRPETALAKQAGIKTGVSGAIIVDKLMETSEKDIYACGDCIEQYHLITGKPVYRPLGSTANKTGRITGENITGGSLEFRGILGTGIFRVFDLAVAQTGLSEREALAEGYSITVSHNIKPNKAEYMGGKEIVIKAIADNKDGRLLGAQIVGEEGVDKRIDVFVAAISFGARAEDLFHLDLAYAPPFSTTKDPVMYSGMILDNAMKRGRPLITAGELDSRLQSGEKLNLIDARVAGQYEKEHIEGAINLPHEKIRDEAEKLDKDIVTVTYCNKGVTGNAAQNILINKGFRKVYNISGGHRTYALGDKERQNLGRQGKSIP
ncbi:MAG: FAD-dependent oxidoreductase [Clostridiales bacterium]|nr:FAD-dependent oxidoreductase [Clostridiales bacterium]